VTDIGFVISPPAQGVLADNTSAGFAMKVLAAGSAAAGVTLWRASRRIEI